MTRRSSRKDPVAALGRAGPQPHHTTGSHLHPRAHGEHGAPTHGDGSTTHGDEGSGAHAGRERPSKSQLKREMNALQDLGEQLLALPPAKLRTLPIPQQLIEAVELGQRIRNSREGLRRQRQYIGRLMRDIDAEPLRDALSADGAHHRREVAAMHAAEHWRERLLADPKALAEFVGQFPHAGPGLESELAKLIDETRAELARGQPTRHHRELFRRLRDTISTEPTP